MTDIAQEMKKRFDALPESIRHSIADAHVEQKLRTLAQKHSLHLDKWVLLENEIMLILLGIEDAKDMVTNVAREVNIDVQRAEALVKDVITEVFDPIRAQMQQELSEGGREAHARASERAAQERAHAQNDVPTAHTPEPERPDIKSRPTDNTVYRPGESSAGRRDVEEDPYRESIE